MFNLALKKKALNRTSKTNRLCKRVKNEHLAVSSLLRSANKEGGGEGIF